MYKLIDMIINTFSNKSSKNRNKNIQTVIKLYNMTTEPSVDEYKINPIPLENIIKHLCKKCIPIFPKHSIEVRKFENNRSLPSFLSEGKSTDDNQNSRDKYYYWRLEEE